MSTNTPRPESGANFTKTIHNDTYPFISPKNTNHKGHYVLITGASKGIGLATALSFAQAGASGIALCARSDFTDLESKITAAAKEAGHSSPEILKIKLDITSYKDVESAAKTVGEKWGKLDILINNAGYLSEFNPATEGNMDEWWRNYEVNLRGIYWMCRVFIPLLLKSEQKTLVNISSIGAHLILPGASGYQVSKLAVLRFTEFLMVDHGEQGLLAYAVHPGAVKSELGLGLPEYMHAVLVDEPELAADSICWLSAGGKTRKWLCGRYLSVNWDFEELCGMEKEVVEGDKLKMRLVV